MNIIHGDHGLSEAHWAFVADSVRHESGFFLRAFALPEELAGLPANLFGPQEGDPAVHSSEVFYLARNGRDIKSRLVKRPARTGRYVIVIGVADDNLTTIYTAYGSVCGVIAPREVGDPSMDGDSAAMEESAQFWATHALGVE